MTPQRQLIVSKDCDGIKRHVRSGDPNGGPDEEPLGWNAESLLDPVHDEITEEGDTVDDDEETREVGCGERNRLVLENVNEGSGGRVAVDD